MKLDCPNCGSTSFARIAPHEYECTYCGTMLMLPEDETKPERVVCPHCGGLNERGDRYCNNCGRPLRGWLLRKGKKIDPALLSIIVTVGGSLILPLGSAIVGLILGYKALKDARTGPGQEQRERLARAAVVIGWIVLASSVLPVCAFGGMSGVERICSLCEAVPEEIFDALSDVVRELK